MRHLGRILSGAVKRTGFRLLRGVARLDRSGAREERLQSWLIRRFGRDRAKLRALAWFAEAEGDTALAMIAWQTVAMGMQRGAPERCREIRERMAGLELDLRRRVELDGTSCIPDLDPPLPGHDKRRHADGTGGGHVQKMSPYLRRTRHAFLARYWSETVPALPQQGQEDLRKIYLGLAAKAAKGKKFDDTMRALAPVLLNWPDDQNLYLHCYRATLEEIFAETAPASDLLAQWWHLFDARKTCMTPETLSQIWRLSNVTSQKLNARKMPDVAEQVISPVFQRWPDEPSALKILAQAAALRGDNQLAASYWQLMAALINPVTTKSCTHVAENAEERLRQSRYALNQLRMTRFRLAHELHAQGRKREFSELLCRAVEAIPDQRIFKKERVILDAVRKYVQDALVDDQVRPANARCYPDTPKRIAICLDILKLSDVHTHSRVVFAICRNMLRIDPSVETHILITNERFVVTTPVVNASFNPNADTALREAAQAALGEDYGKRFFLHSFQSTGLEPLIDTCKQIIRIDPDVILYGGGHRGLFSNESRAVRHCLHDYFPSAFFYIQANNEVDEKFDMIIARGPHEIMGENGFEKVQVRVQPYPTIVEETLDEICEPAKQKNRIIVSAITGVRMDVRMKEMSVTEFEAFFSILDKVPGAVWHFIGSTDPEATAACNPEMARRVKAGQVVVHPVLPFDRFTDFVGKEAALFLHLPGFTGGSGGASIARRSGVPILTFRHSDVSGRQPEETVFDTMNIPQYTAKAVQLLQNQSEWERVVRLQFAYKNWIRETSAQGFYECLSETMRIGAARIMQSAPQPETALKQVANDRPRLSVVKNTS